MSSPVAPQFQPVHIGSEAKPPLAVLPVVTTLFANRAMRFRTLAPDHQLGGYLTFLAGICDAQAAIIPSLAPAPLPPEDEIARALEFGMAPIARAKMPVDGVMMATLDALLTAVKPLAMPDKAAAALEGVIAAEADEKRAMIANVLSDSLPAEEIAEHIFVAAALQVHFARLASQLDAQSLTPVADGVCPACGGPPLSSSVVGWENAQSTRFATCATCSTGWHVVRVKCVACSSTKGIHYAHLGGTADTIKAECCDECKSYLKQLYLITDPNLEAVADDVASAGLDLKMREDGFSRAGFNVFLAGF
jgi:FdhE protein